MNYIETLQKADPLLTFSIQNYHYEKVSVYDESKKTWKTRSERKNTHAATASFPISSVTDETLSAAQTVAMFHLLHRRAASEDTGLLHETAALLKLASSSNACRGSHYPKTSPYRLSLELTPS